MTARSHFVKRARKDYPDEGIKKGESYYWWQFNFEHWIHRSKTPPTIAQLIHSPFLSQIATIEQGFQNANYDNWESARDDAISELESMRDECQEKLDNMPEQLQESSSSGQLLQERVENLEEMISELENFEAEKVDEDAIKDTVDEELEKDEDETDADFESRKNAEAENRTEQAKEEAVEKLHDISYQGS